LITGLVYVEFVVEKIAIGLVSLLVLRYPPVGIIPLMLHTHSSVTSAITTVTDSVVI
jgi:hypothetical protein